MRISKTDGNYRMVAINEIIQQYKTSKEVLRVSVKQMYSTLDCFHQDSFHFIIYCQVHIQVAERVCTIENVSPDDIFEMLYLRLDQALDGKLLLDNLNQMVKRRIFFSGIFLDIRRMLSDYKSFGECSYYQSSIQLVVEKLEQFVP